MRKFWVSPTFRFEFKKTCLEFQYRNTGALGKPLKLGFKTTDNLLMHFKSNEKNYVVYTYASVTTSVVSF